ncbi:hypothetical protein [Rhizobium leguminosarum]|uniref:hypothetical protein n=1 Tax=Rhizobium leguminosarum TaxID=384 RepID=UPI001C90A0DE|nr:hypothetical protein [Rhizobium leguminosarum]MBY2909901.1 hypothetical protein [Rhizobium leguminosarum]
MDPSIAPASLAAAVTPNDTAIASAESIKRRRSGNLEWRRRRIPSASTRLRLRRGCMTRYYFDVRQGETTIAEDLEV